MRSAQDNARLWEGLSEGYLQTIGTDHCPFFYDGTKPIVYEGHEIAIPGKELGGNDFTKIPNGLPGIEDRLPVLARRRRQDPIRQIRPDGRGAAAGLRFGAHGNTLGNGE